MSLLQVIQSDATIGRAMESFDLYLGSSSRLLNGCTFQPAEADERFAEDGSGGVFLLYGQDQRVLYATSEGQAGIVGRNLREFLTIVLSHPYWFDLLHFSGGGNLSEMKLAVALLESQMKDRPRIDRDRNLLADLLGIKPDPAAVEILHAVVSGSDVHLLGPDGTPFGPLFNTFRAACLVPR